ncbi:hypothetical protein [Streptomyces sp. NPDC047108]|uniref:hypothetical protein n=1 Tax=Streptomyces sp. NPDC047108 TaxID=3155025 RepID=UPI0034057C80
MAWQIPPGDGDEGVWFTSGSHTKAVRKRCERRLAELELPPTSDIHVLVAHIAERLGQPVKLVPRDLDPREVSGQCVLRNGTYWIIYQRNTSHWHQMHIICHELGHLVGGHECIDIGDEAESRPEPTTRILGQSAVARMLGRSHYDSPPEREAEVHGTLLRQHLAAHAAASAGAATWVAPALEHTWGGRV